MRDGPSKSALGWLGALALLLGLGVSLTRAVPSLALLSVTIGASDVIVAFVYGERDAARARRTILARLVCGVILSGGLAAAHWIGHAVPIAIARWAMTAVAIVVAGVAHVAGTIDRPRATRLRLCVGAIVLMLDAVAIVIAGVLATNHQRLVDDGAARPSSMLASATSVGGVLLVRALVVRAFDAASVRKKQTFPSPAVVALVFLAWLSIASLAATIAGDALAWSGLGAALVLAIAAIVLEGRRRARQADVALTRAMLGFIVSATLSALLLFA